MPPLARERSTSQYSDLGSRDSYPECRGRVKCALVGDGAVGKTSLIVSYTTNGYPLEYIPTAFDNYNVVVNVEDQPILLQLCDTAGQDDFDSLRGLCYPGTDVYVVCFSVVSPASFTNVAARWLPEIRQHNPQAAVILVGTQTDLRSDVKVLIELARYRKHAVSEVEARRLAETLGLAKYVECSALTQQNLKEVFDEAILLALRNNEELRRITVGRSKSRRILASLQQWRGSFSSDRGGLLRSSRRSKSSKDGADISSSSTVSSSTIQQQQQYCVSKDRSSRISQSSQSPRRKTSLWRRFCCLG